MPSDGTPCFLAVAQGALYGTLPLLLLVGNVAVVHLTGRERWSGVYIAAYFLAAATGALLGAISTEAAVVGAGLFLVGLGWSAAFLGATATISYVTAPSERGGALGFTDLLVSLSSGAGGLLGGLVLEAGGYGAIGIAVAVALAPAVLLVLPLREPAPGRWELAAPVPVEP